MHGSVSGRKDSNVSLTPFQCYQMYIAIKRHFSSSYDYFKYNGKVNVSQTSFDTRRDKYMFYKMSKRSDPQGYLVANLFNNPNVWIGDVFSDKGEQIYKQWKKRQQTLTYTFKQEITNLDDNYATNFTVVDGQHPPLLRLYQQGVVGAETMLILNSFVRFMPYWNKAITDDIIWPDIYTKLKKYRKFITFDSDSFKQITKERFA